MLSAGHVLAWGEYQCAVAHPDRASQRALLGFTIGISGLRLHWALHGILLGIIVGLPWSVGIFFGKAGATAWMYFLFGAVWGLLIEVITSVVCRFKAATE
jgi:hypothetical protein